MIILSMIIKATNLAKFTISEEISNFKKLAIK